jgi:kumamolisin
MNKNYSNRIELSGSHKPAPQAEKIRGVDKREAISVSVHLRPKQPLPVLTDHAQFKRFKTLSSGQYKSRHGAMKSDIVNVSRFAHFSGLSVIRNNVSQRVLEIRGSIAHFEKAFGVELENYALNAGRIFRGRSGPITIPKEFENVIQGIFGLDNRPAASPKFQVFRPSISKDLMNSFYPNELAGIYDFPSQATGKKRCIAIVELGGGYRTEDVNNYFLGLGIKVPEVVAISVDGGINDPSSPDSADSEVMLDIEVAGAIAPDAVIAVYFAPNTDKGFLDAINAAIHGTDHHPDVISISWGASENLWTAQSLDSYNSAFQAAAAMGITICAAAGDRGSSDGVTDGLAHVDFPASSPYVLACGGTRLTTDGNSVKSETVWHESADSATGGGVSSVFDLPSYQQNANVPVSVNSNSKGRGVPDIAAVADPATGYKVLVDGNQLVIGGTSAVAPLMAGLIVRINEMQGKNIGFIHHSLYNNAAVCRDIIQGDNITTSTNKGYKAQAGWDACSGWGAPIGSKWAKVMG